jgi:3-oxoacyl-[acyl-carrier protein] reductase
VPAPSSDLTAAGAVAIVTGGSSEAGRKLVEALAGRGFAVVLVYLSDQSRADAVVDDIIAKGGTALTVRADVSDNLDVERIFDESSAAFGGVDLVVHAAPRAGDVVFAHAERRLRWGGATMMVSCADDVADALSYVDSWSSTTGG